MIFLILKCFLIIINNLKRSLNVHFYSQKQKCGNVTNWKRVKGPNGKLQAFGFCDYAEADSALRAIRLLHDFEIGDKKLLVKVDAKTNEKLETYAKENESKSSGEESNKEDEKVMDLIKTILKENESELMLKTATEDKTESSSNNNAPAITPQIQTPRNQIPAEPNLQNFSDMDIEDEKKTLIHREIGKFRSTYKKQDEEKEKLDAERAKERELRREKDRRDRERNNRDRDIRERVTPSRDRKLDTRYERESSNSSRYDNRSERNDRNSERNSDRNSDRTSDYRNERDLSNRSAYEDDEIIEMRRQQREERKKEQAFQKRLKDWENREERKKRQYEKEKCRLIEKKKEEEKELLRLKQFLEDYNDDLDDVKYYKGSNFVRKLREFEKEQEQDEIDRNSERKELDDLRKKLADKGHPDPEMEAKKIMSDSRSNKQIELSNNGNHGIERLTHLKQSQQTNNSSLNNEEIHVKSFTLTKQDNRQLKNNSTINSNDTITIDTHITPVSDFQNSSSAIPNDKKKKSLSLHDVFNSNEDDDKSQIAKKRKLPVFIDDNTDSNQSLASNNKNSTDSKLLSSDDKRKQIKAVIDSIPTTKEELFKYEIEWDYVDSQLMEKRIRPWINKKITEYIGEEEKALLDFICGKLHARCNAQSILDDVAMVLDDEAEVFIVKMLRLLIYEIEAKKLGLGK